MHVITIISVAAALALSLPAILSTVGARRHVPVRVKRDRRPG